MQQNTDGAFRTWLLGRWPAVLITLIGAAGILAPQSRAHHRLLTPALAQLSPFGAAFSEVTMATGVAVTALACWAVIPAAVGAWRTLTRDA